MFVNIGTGTEFSSVDSCLVLYGKISWSLILVRDRGGTVVKVLCYKSEGRWFDPS